MIPKLPCWSILWRTSLGVLHSPFLELLLLLAHSFLPFQTSKNKTAYKNPQWFQCQMLHQCQMLPLYLKLQILCSFFIIKTTTTRVKCQNNFSFSLAMSFSLAEGEFQESHPLFPWTAAYHRDALLRRGEISLHWREWMGFLKWLNV